jgi:hypothetical protein
VREDFVCAAIIGRSRFGVIPAVILSIQPDVVGLKVACYERKHARAGAPKRGFWSFITSCPMPTEEKRRSKILSCAVGRTTRTRLTGTSMQGSHCSRASGLAINGREAARFWNELGSGLAAPTTPLASGHH